MEVVIMTKILPKGVVEEKIKWIRRNAIELDILDAAMGPMMKDVEEMIREGDGLTDVPLEKKQKTTK